MRKHFLVKPRLQLKYLMWTLGAILLSFGLGYLLFESMVNAAMRDGLIREADWLVIRGDLRLGFAVVLVMLLAAVGIENYFLVHTIVGPLVALEKGLRKITKGDYSDPVKIRDSDQLAELVGAFEEMKLSLRSRENARPVAPLVAEIDAMVKMAVGESLEPLRRKLDDLKKRLQTENL